MNPTTDFATATIALTSLAQDVDKGLSARNKFLPSSYFYDEQGSRLFQQIMDLPEYYLSRCEAAILHRHKKEVQQIFETPQGFDLIELGAGDGTKTAILLAQFLSQNIDFQYKAIDISDDALIDLEARLQHQFPNLSVEMLADDYFLGLERIQLQSKRRKVILFLGSTIGNFTYNAAIQFLSKLRSYLNENDLLFIGFDLKKEPALILDAYNDNQGVTAEFNYNLLRRINQELGGNFVVENFVHAPIYHPQNGCAESYLLSKVKQKVFIEALNKSFYFDEWEAIHTEVSYKYSMQDMAKLANAAGFRPQSYFSDEKRFFCDAVWQTDLIP